MSDYFVKPASAGGNDANSGATWALAKATVQAGINLCTVAGDRCIVAPGWYQVRSVTPPSAGARGSQKWLIGDVANAYADGGGLYSGRTGYVVCDASGLTGPGTNGPGGVKTLDASNNWAYWSFEGLFFTGGIGTRIAGTSATANDGVIIRNCIFDAYAGPALEMYYWVVDSAVADIQLQRCYFNTRFWNSIYASALYIGENNRAGSFRAAPEYRLIRSIFTGSRNAVCLEVLAGRFLKIQVENCSLHAPADNTVAPEIFYCTPIGASYHITIDDSLMIGGTRTAGPGTVSTLAITNTAEYIYGTGLNWARVPIFPPIVLQFPDSSVIGALAVPTRVASPDIFGTPVPQGAAQDYGAQELQAGRYPKEPTGKPGGGGGGGGIVRIG